METEQRAEQHGGLGAAAARVLGKALQQVAGAAVLRDAAAVQRLQQHAAEAGRAARLQLSDDHLQQAALQALGALGRNCGPQALAVGRQVGRAGRRAGHRAAPRPCRRGQRTRVLCGCGAARARLCRITVQRPASRFV